MRKQTKTPKKPRAVRAAKVEEPVEKPFKLKTHIKTFNESQRIYKEAIEENDMVFGLGPAGTGKTFLAMAMAIDAYINKDVTKIILIRPIVEAGEKMGFLPGTLQEKADPYLRPLYDALHELLSGEHVKSLFEKRVIEVAPLAFMRGRTLKNAFIIMDEAQNTTDEQMKMFLTRMGEGSVAVITGDMTQIDLPKHIKSGLVRAQRLLSKIDGIEFCEFHEADVVRHPLVKKIVKAYEEDTE